MKKRLRSIGNSLAPAVFLAALGFLWEAAVGVFDIKDYLLPAPSAIWAALTRRFSLIVQHSKATLLEAVLGLAASIAVALVLAVLLNRFVWLKRLLYPVFVITQTVPIIALAPVMMLWFGLGTLPKVLIVVLVCFFPLVVSITEGLGAVDQDLINLMRVMGATDWKIFRAVELPATLPSFFAGLRIAATYSVMGAVIGEWLGGNQGIGVYMMRTMHSFQTDSLFAAIAVVVALSILVFLAVEGIARLVMPWQRAKTEE